MLLVDLSSDSAAPNYLSLLATTDSSLFVPIFMSEHMIFLLFQEEYQ